MKCPICSGYDVRRWYEEHTYNCANCGEFGLSIRYIMDLFQKLFIILVYRTKRQASTIMVYLKNGYKVSLVTCRFCGKNLIYTKSDEKENSRMCDSCWKTWDIIRFRCKFYNSYGTNLKGCHMTHPYTECHPRSCLNQEKLMAMNISL